MSQAVHGNAQALLEVSRTRDAKTEFPFGTGKVGFMPVLRSPHEQPTGFLRERPVRAGDSGSLRGWRGGGRFGDCAKIQLCRHALRIALDLLGWC